MSYLVTEVYLLPLIYGFLFFKFLLDNKKPDYSIYFRAMFSSYRKSSLRVPFKALIIAVEYTIGIIVTGIILSAYYPAYAIRTGIKKILIAD